MLREHVVQVVDRVAEHGLHGTPQNAQQASYDRQLQEEELHISWQRPGREIERKIRACYPFTPARFKHHGRTVEVLAARFDPTPANGKPGTVLASHPEVCVATGQGTVRILSAVTPGIILRGWPSVGNRPLPGEMLE